MTTLITSQAPDAKPVGLSAILTTSWDSLIEVPDYQIPVETFGGGIKVVPGVGEIISPLLICNTTGSTVTISLRIYRDTTSSYFMLANNMPIPANDIIAIPLNGQFIATNDILEAKASSNNALNVTISYTVGQAEQDDVDGETTVAP